MATTARKGRPRPEAGVQSALGAPTATRPAADRLTVVDRRAVEHLLKEETGLADLVSEAADQLVDFIPDARLRLELLKDPDYGEGEQLFLEVATGLEDGEARETLRRFDQEWWVHHVQRARGLLCIDLSDE
jgi:hypothetical protein